MLPIHRVNWEDFIKELKCLAGKIEEAPDLIVGISRGGLVPARLLATYLKVKDLHCLSVRKIGGERKVVTEITDDIRGKRILLVEDMLETGKSLIVAKKHLESKAALVKTACLYTMPVSEIEPDFFLRQVKEIEKFPWESES
ncbi:MAG: hypothetical protein HYT76_02590 [Deltaproteobacteria bacterium]|nr:hypothetical protein [Deltaproteobacteria bacterium]